MPILVMDSAHQFVVRLVERGKLLRLYLIKLNRKKLKGRYEKNTKKKRQSRVRIQFIAARARLFRTKQKKEPACSVVEQAGVPIDRVFGLSRERKGLFYLLTLESIGFVVSKNEDLAVTEELTMFILSFNRSDVSGRVFFYYIEKIFPLVCIPI